MTSGYRQAKCEKGGRREGRIAELPIPVDRGKVAAFCRARGIGKLSPFGSVVPARLARAGWRT